MRRFIIDFVVPVIIGALFGAGVEWAFGFQVHWPSVAFTVALYVIATLYTSATKED